MPRAKRKTPRGSDLEINPDHVTDEESMSTDAFEEFSIDDPVTRTEFEEDMEVPGDPAADIRDEDLDFEDDAGELDDLGDLEGGEDPEDLEASDEDLIDDDELFDLREENQTLKKRLDNLEKTAGTRKRDEQLSNLEEKIKTAKDDLQKALDEGDAELSVKAQSDIAELMATRVSLKTKEDISPTEDPQDSSAPRATNPTAARYMRMNPWINDKKNVNKTNILISIDRELIEEDFDPTTDAYYQEMGRRFNLLYPKQFKTSRRKSVNKSKARRGKGGSKPLKTNTHRSAMTGGADTSGSKTPNRNKQGRPLSREEAINMRRFGLDPMDKKQAEAYIQNRDLAERKEKYNRQRGY